MSASKSLEENKAHRSLAVSILFTLLYQAVTLSVLSRINHKLPVQWQFHQIFT
jgi:hypothetical protein